MKQQSYFPSFSVGIDPAGIGTTGIFIKAIGTRFPHYKYVQVKCSNPTDSANEILTIINNFKNKHHDLSLNVVVVENLHMGPEKMREVRATRELIGILRYELQNKMQLHYPADKNKEMIKKELKERTTKNEHSIHAKAILEAHFREKEFGYKCEKYNWEVIDYGTKKNW